MKGSVKSRKLKFYNKKKSRLCCNKTGKPVFRYELLIINNLHTVWYMYVCKKNLLYVIIQHTVICMTPW